MKAVTVLCLLVAAVHSQTNPAQIPENPILYGFHMIIGVSFNFFIQFWFDEI